MKRTASIFMAAALVACGGGADPATTAPPPGDETGAMATAPQPVDAGRPGAAAPDEQQLLALREAVAKDPEDDDARRRLAIALHDSRRFHEAVEEFERLFEQAPSVRGAIDLALAYTSVSRLSDAESRYEWILEQSKEHPIALHNLGNLAMRRADVQGAIGYYRRAIGSKPDYLLAFYHLGDAQKQAGLLEEAYRSYETVLSLEPATPADLTAYDDALYQLAALDISMGAYERAGQYLTELLRVNPKHRSANYAMGQVLLALGRPEDAQRAFDAHTRVLEETQPEGPAATGD